MGTPEIIDNPHLDIYEWLRMGTYAVRESYLAGRLIVPFADLWLEFTEDDTGLSAPLPAGWQDSLYMHLSWRGVGHDDVIAALRGAWAVPLPPGVTRFDLFIMELDALQDWVRGEPVPEIGGGERLVELARRRDAFRVMLAEEFGRELRSEQAASAHRRAERAERRSVRAERAEELRAVGLLVRRRRHETEDPAPVHYYDCHALTKQHSSPFVAERYEGFDTMPEGAIACRTCNPHHHDARVP